MPGRDGGIGENTGFSGPQTASGLPGGARRSLAVGNVWDQQPEPLAEPDPVVWPLFAAAVPVEELVVQEGRPLTPTWLALEFGELPCVGGLLDVVELAPALSGVPAAGPVALGSAAFSVGLPGVAALLVGPVEGAPAVSAAGARPVLQRSATVAGRANRCLI
jgi:hypothetical protein